MPTPTPAPADLTVSIVSHGQLPLVLPLLRQIDRWGRGCVARVVLTCNIPEPDLLAGERFGFELVRIDNARPLGFGANHNQAFARCDGAWFLVLNPDIRIEGELLAGLLARAQPRSGLLAPRIVEPGKPAPEQHRDIITPLEILRRKRPGYAIPRQPAWIPGLFMLFRREAYAAVGGFDTRFFMYGEDFDICARLQLAGWRLQIAEDLQAVHDARRASHRSHRHLAWHLSSLFKVWSSAAFWRLLRARRERTGAWSAADPRP